MKPGSARLSRHRAAFLLVLVAPGAPLATEETVHRNRLAAESSPYLLQHASNPVDWYPWGEEALEAARRTGKPIFLSVGYSTCHWCHVMERESFEDAEVAGALNAAFIAVKVDREERPDVDDLYMTAVQMMTGHGGWPMSVWLTPEGRPFFGGTYFRKEQFLELIAQLAAAWREERSAMEAHGQRVWDAVAAQRSAAASAKTVSPEVQAAAVAAAAARFDPRHGGFGGAPKFPSETVLLLLLDRYQRSGEARPLEMAVTSLRRMAAGGIHDHLGGGFHRYSVDARWLVPHFEKMLYNQAWLGRACLEAWRLTGDRSLLDALRGILAYVERDLTSPEGAFYTAEDADSEGEEGTFYVWRPAEIDAVLGDEDGPLFRELHGVSEHGNFEHGTTVLHLPQPLEEAARRRGLEPEVLRSRVEAMRQRLLRVREARVRPLRDDKVLAGWNGMMIATFARAGAVLDEKRYRDRAARAADFVLGHLRGPDGGLLRAYRGGQAKIPAFQEDYAYLIDGLLELHGATGEPRRLAQARELADRMRQRFEDREHGGFFATDGSQPASLPAGKDAYDGAVPSGNAVAAHALARLARLTGEMSYGEAAERTVAAFAGDAVRSPLAYTYLLLAAASLTEGEAGPEGVDRRGVLSAHLDPPRMVTGGDPEMALRLGLRLRDGWHVNAHRPGAAELVPTLVEVEGSAAPAVLLEAAYPAGEEIRPPFADGPVAVYRGEVRIPLRLRRAAGERGPAVLRVTLRYQACDDQKCYPPERLLLEVPLLPGTG